MRPSIKPTLPSVPSVCPSLVLLLSALFGLKFTFPPLAYLFGLFLFHFFVFVAPVQSIRPSCPNENGRRGEGGLAIGIATAPSGGGGGGDGDGGGGGGLK